ncbi:MAG: hypothetical protein QFX33_03050 [Candidatus Nezhaarchaeota archaeon]|nr:hypothetical protein [Candidatus Nezhaarchaeota archaeon]
MWLTWFQGKVVAGAVDEEKTPIKNVLVNDDEMMHYVIKRVELRESS